PPFRGADGGEAGGPSAPGQGARKGPRGMAGSAHGHAGWGSGVQPPRRRGHRSCAPPATRSGRMNMLFVLSLMVAMLALVAVFIEIPFVSNFAFWALMAAYVLLAGSQAK